MPLIRKLRRAGGSLSLVIPANLAEMLGFSADTAVTIRVHGGQLVVERHDPAASLDAGPPRDAKRARTGARG